MKKLFVIASIAMMASPALAASDSAPTIANVPAKSSPPVPAGLKVTCMPDGTSLIASATCPVIQYRGITTWAYSFIDNRVSMALVSYDAKNNIVGNITKDGARYVWQITSTPQNRTVTITGQSDQTVSTTWDDLAKPK